MPVNIELHAAHTSARLALIEHLMLNIFRELSNEQKLRIIVNFSETSEGQKDLSLFSILPESFLASFEECRAQHLAVMRALISN